MDEGGRVPLLAHHHLAADYDSAAREDLRVTVITLPMYGYLENTRTGKSLGSVSSLLPGGRERRNCHAGGQRGCARTCSDLTVLARKGRI